MKEKKERKERGQRGQRGERTERRERKSLTLPFFPIGFSMSSRLSAVHEQGDQMSW
jgi:hypothetical protein